MFSILLGESSNFVATNITDMATIDKKATNKKALPEVTLGNSHSQGSMKPRVINEAKKMVSESGAAYNKKRPHLGLKYKTPDEVHRAC